MKIHKQQRGMAFMEVLVTMVIFALALIPLVKLQILSFGATQAGYYKTEAVASAESMMDYLRRDLNGIFKGKWDNVVATAGEDCNQIGNPQTKEACLVLNNTLDRNVFPTGNAILCVFGQRGRVDNADRKTPGLDQHLISIRTIWYSGKRGMTDPDLNAADCGKDFNTPLRQATLDKDNIESVVINMAY